MPDDKQNIHEEDAFALENILQEVSGWLEEESRQETPLPEVLLDLMPPAPERPEGEPKPKAASPDKPSQRQPPKEKAVPSAPKKAGMQEMPQTQFPRKEARRQHTADQSRPPQEESPISEGGNQPAQEPWSGRPDVSAFGEPMIPNQVIRLPTPKGMRPPAIRLPIDRGEEGEETAPVPPGSKTAGVETHWEAGSASPQQPEETPGESPAGAISDAAAADATAGAEGVAQETASADREAAGPPDNVIPLYPPKEPETIREAVTQAARQAKGWAREGKDQFTPPKIRIKRPRLPRLPDPPLPPDTDPRALAKTYGEGLARLRLLVAGAFLCVLALLVLTLFQEIDALPFPTILAQGQVMGWVGFGLFALSCLICLPALGKGLGTLFGGRPGMETVALLAALMVAADALTLLLLELRTYSMPHYLPMMTVLAFQLLGIYLKRKQQRIACRTAAQTARPDRLTVEPHPSGGGAVYRRRPGTNAGFGSQIQQADGAEKAFRLYAPVAVLLAVGLSILATAAKGSPQLLCWALSGGLIAAATLGGCLCFSLPNRELSPRLAREGVALAGWAGIRKTKPGASLLVEDIDLFPPGSVKITSARTFESFSQEKVFSVTASVIRATGSGLEDVFGTLMRMEGGTFVTVSDLEQHKDGISARALGEEVLVGTASFLERMGIALPQGVRVKTGAFTAIGRSFAGQFVLSYSLHKRAMPAMDSLLTNRITPVLAALDFNLAPPLLRKLFRFPWDRMSFPELEQRRKLLEAPPHGDSALLAMLGVEGLAPLAIAAAGAQRFRRALCLCLCFTLLGGLIGIGLAFYLAQAAALTALSPLNLTAFLLLWALPLFLISGWVNQF